MVLANIALRWHKTPGMAQAWISYGSKTLAPRCPKLALKEPTDHLILQVAPTIGVHTSRGGLSRHVLTYIYILEIRFSDICSALSPNRSKHIGPLLSHLERVGPRSPPPLWSNGLPLAFIGPPPLVDLPSWLLPTPWWSMCPPGRPMTAQERQITTRNTSSDTMLNEVTRLCCSAISNRIFTLVLCCFVYSFCR